MPLCSTPHFRCSFWHEQAQELAEQAAGACLMLYEVLISKRRDENSWEIGSWRDPAVFTGSGRSAVLGPQCVCVRVV